MCNNSSCNASQFQTCIYLSTHNIIAICMHSTCNCNALKLLSCLLPHWFASTLHTYGVCCCCNTLQLAKLLAAALLCSFYQLNIHTVIAAVAFYIAFKIMQTYIHTTVANAMLYSFKVACCHIALQLCTLHTYCSTLWHLNY